jgi:hypothetical protein
MLALLVMVDMAAWAVSSSHLTTAVTRRVSERCTGEFPYPITDIHNLT